MGGGAVDTTTGAFSIISFCRLSLLSSRDERSDERRCEIFLFESNESNNESSSRTSRQPADVDQSDHQITQNFQNRRLHRKNFFRRNNPAVIFFAVSFLP